CCDPDSAHTYAAPRQRLPGGLDAAAHPPRPPPVGHCAPDGSHTAPVEGRLRRSAPAPTSLLSAIGFRYVHSSDGVRSVSLLPERKRQFAKPSLDPIRFDIREGLTVHTRGALVRAALGIGMGQDVLAADLVVQGIEAIAGFCLSFRV